MSKWLQNLNPEQIEAVLHQNGPLLVLAGAGSGKTTLLVARAGYMIDVHKINPANLMVLTFTNKAARELKTRVSAKLGVLGEKIWAGTFHALGVRFLREFHEAARIPKQFSILDTSDATGIVKECLSEFKTTKNDFKVDWLLKVMQDMRSIGKAQVDAKPEYIDMAEVLLPRYLAKKERLGAVDFEDLLLLPLKLFRENPELLEKVRKRFTHWMVDEFQDTNKTQLELVELLSKPLDNLAVVGDDDQSIYGWRGACIENILHFPRHHKNCKVVSLTRNYRSTPLILNMANAIIAKNQDRHNKVLKAEMQVSKEAVKPEVFVFEDEATESERVIQEISELMKSGVVGHEIAILYRSNMQSAGFEAELRKNRVLYEVSGGISFFDRKEIKDILSYIRVAMVPNDMAVRRIINSPSRGIGDQSLDKIFEHAKSVNRSVWQVLRNPPPGLPSVALSGIQTFLEQIARLNEILAAADGTVSKRLLSYFEDIGFLRVLRAQEKSPEKAQRRVNIVQSFLEILDRFVVQGVNSDNPVAEFLQKMELRDEGGEEIKENAVQLMTLHAAKGLEFDAVFLVGVEEDSLPHRSLGGNIAEERRLFYVGITRAKHRLILTRNSSRIVRGRAVRVSPSRFLVELGGNLVETHFSGFRPVSSENRNQMLAGLMGKLDALAKSQAVPK